MEDARARRATPVASLSLVERLTAAKAPGNGSADGFSHDHVTRETAGGVDTEAQRVAADKSPPLASTGDEPLASDQGPVSTGSGTTDTPQSEPQSSPTNSLSTESAQLPSSDAQSETPAAAEAHAEAVAGNNIGSSATPPEADGEGVGDDAMRPAASSPTAGAPLPQGWEITYSSALRRAQSKASLPKFAKLYWAQYGSWEDHKDGPNGKTAVAIYDAFNNNFGNKEQIELLLRELI